MTTIFSSLLTADFLSRRAITSIKIPTMPLPRFCFSIKRLAYRRNINGIFDEYFTTITRRTGVLVKTSVRGVDFLDALFFSSSSPFCFEKR